MNFSPRRRTALVRSLLLALCLGGCGFPLLDHSTYRAPDYVPPPARVAPYLASTVFGGEVARAVATDPQLDGGGARVRASRADLDATRASALPQVSIGMDLVVGLLGVATGTRYLPTAQVSQLLFDGGRLRARVESSRLGIVGRLIERDSLAAQLTLSAVEAWFELEHQRRLSQVASRNVEVHEGYIDQLSQRLQGGIGIQGELEIALGRKASALARAATVQADLERAEANFLRIFGTVPVTLSAAPMSPTLPAGTDADLIANSPRIRALDVAITVSEAGVAAAAATWWPTMSIGARGQYDLRTGLSGLQAIGAPRYDVFSGGQQAATVDLATARLDELRAERRQLELDIARTLAVLRSDARAGQQRVRATQDAIRANSASAAASRERFVVGRTTILQLLDAQRDLALSEELASIAVRDISLSGYAALALTGDIMHAFGISLPDLGVTLNGQGLATSTELPPGGGAAPR